METIAVSSPVSSQYQVVIPKAIRKVLSLKAGDMITWIVSKAQVLVKPRPRSWAEYTSGLGKEIWEGIDADAWIRQERDEWDK